MRVTWITDHKNIPSMVKYGMISGKYDEKATREHTSYQYIFYHSGKIHHVVFRLLAPSTNYYYKHVGHGPIYLFKTPPLTFPIEFIVVGKYAFPLRAHFFGQFGVHSIYNIIKLL